MNRTRHTCAAVIVGVFLSFASLPSYAQQADPLFGVLPILVKAGALGFAIISVYLAYMLLKSGKKWEGYIFLPVTLVASLIFLYAEYVMRQTEVTFVRYPNDIEDSVPGPIVRHNRTELRFQDNVIERIVCKAPMDFSVDARPLLKAREKALARAREAEARALRAAALSTTATEAAAVGLDDSAGGAP